jgi:lipoate-protein ligase A
MEATFRGLYGLTESDVTADELARAELLVAEKFATPEWLYRVP